jgi:hypothetical protein
LELRKMASSPSELRKKTGAEMREPPRAVEQARRSHHGQVRRRERR